MIVSVFATVVESGEKVGGVDHGRLSGSGKVISALVLLAMIVEGGALVHGKKLVFLSIHSRLRYSATDIDAAIASLELRHVDHVVVRLQDLARSDGLGGMRGARLRPKTVGRSGPSRLTVELLTACYGI